MITMPQENYSSQNLKGRSFQGQDLTGADFSQADIRSADFSGAVLKGADFTAARAGLGQVWLASSQCPGHYARRVWPD